MRLFPIMSALCLALAGCASQPPSAPVGYARADGYPADPAQIRLILAQCQGEGAAGVPDYVVGGPVPWVAGMFTRASKETTLINACMARNGYLAQ